MTELTGRHVFAITTGAFGVIIAVNLVLAWQAVATFPGLEVPNSYVAGVGFDKRRADQIALGWEVTAGYADGTLSVAITDDIGPVQPRNLTLDVGRLTEAADDQTPAAVWTGSGYTATVTLQPGVWRVDVRATAANGTGFLRRLQIRVRQ